MRIHAVPHVYQSLITSKNTRHIPKRITSVKMLNASLASTFWATSAATSCTKERKTLNHDALFACSCTISVYSCRENFRTITDITSQLPPAPLPTLLRRRTRNYANTFGQAIQWAMGNKDQGGEKYPSTVDLSLTQCPGLCLNGTAGASHGSKNPSCFFTRPAMYTACKPDCNPIYQLLLLYQN